MSKLVDNHWGNICERVDTCALTGAAAFAAGIKDAKILANGPLWCYFYALRYLENAEYNMGERFFGSQPDNNAVVYGAEKYILAALERLKAEEKQPSCLLIESSCSLSLIGDDLAGIARKAELPYPVVTMDCGGMLGGFAEGYAKAAKQFFAAIADKNVAVEIGSINVLGLTDFYLNGHADAQEICRLLRKAGYIIQAAPGSNSSFGSVEALRNLGKAQLNIVTNEELGLPLAKYLEQHFGTPYILAGMPYGVEGTMAWMEKINAALPAPQLAKVAEEAQKLRNYLIGRQNDISCNWGRLWYDEVLVSAPPTIALCMAQTLRNEWMDMRTLHVYCQRQLPQSQASDYCQTADAVYTAGVDEMKLETLFANPDKVLILGSSSESSVLYRKNHSHFQTCNIAFPVNDELILAQMSFVGLNGSKYMLERLWNGFIRSNLQK